MLRAAEAHYLRQQRLAAAATSGARRAWGRVRLSDLDASGREYLRVVAPLASLAQRAAASGAAGYVAEAVAEQGIPDDSAGLVNVGAFAGVASDGRPLDSLLWSPVTTVKARIGDGWSNLDALTAGRSALDRIVATQVQDAGRSAVGVAVASRPHLGYVRMLNPPSCSRCAILAGRFFRWDAGFQRHPLCDCQHVPTTQQAAPGLISDPVEAFGAGQIRGLSQADAQALRDGADMSRVVNALRKGQGMTTAGGLKATREATTRAGRLPGQAAGVRLRPEAIYQLASDRADAIRLLRRFGYLT